MTKSTQWPISAVVESVHMAMLVFLLMLFYGEQIYGQAKLCGCQYELWQVCAQNNGAVE
ncbi:hypothetical protein NFHSH190041_13520 [Shewanella sp. NFH-SH190041]|nr:hypothetical protein NFHSH190041_13520 [Shewanella sp. NFH-SH190041]